MIPPFVSSFSLKVLISFSRIFVVLLLLFSFILFEKKVSSQTTDFPLGSQVEATFDKALSNHLAPANRVYFEKNLGQFNDKVKFRVRQLRAHEAFLTNHAAVFVLPEKKFFRQREVKPSEFSDSLLNKQAISRDDSKAKATVVKLSFAEPSSHTSARGKELLSHRTNYFKGPRERWLRDVPNFQEVEYEGLMPETKLTWRGTENGILQPIFTLADELSTAPISVEIEGASAVYSNNDKLMLVTEFGEIPLAQPLFVLPSDTFRGLIASKVTVRRLTEGKFRVEFYPDETEPKSFPNSPVKTETELVPSTTLAYSTYFGGASTEGANSVRVDSANQAVYVGDTLSIDLPVTSGTIDIDANGDGDVFVAKLDAPGANLVFSTYLGGVFNDYGIDVWIDASNNIYITGYTESSNFPTTSGAFDTSFNGGAFDAYVAKITSTGNALIYSTFLGDADSEFGLGITVDAAGNAVVVGPTNSSSFPVVGAYDSSYNGALDVFVSKFNPTASGLIFSTFVGGTNDESAEDVAVDSSGNVYFTGNTNSSDYPTAFRFGGDGAIGPTNQVLVTKLAASGSALVYSTLIGGSASEIGNDIALSPAGQACVVGETLSPDFPTTPGAFDTTPGSVGTDAFVLLLNSAGSGLVFSTFLGGDFFGEAGSSVVADATGFLVTGPTASPDFPFTPGAFDTSYNGSIDAFISKFSFSGALTYSTYFGGSAFDSANSIALDSAQNFYIAGATGSNDLPVTGGAFDTSDNGGGDAFVAKFAAVPTAASVTIAGRVLDENARGVGNALVSITTQDGLTISVRTNNFGYFRFNEIQSGQTVVLQTKAKGLAYRPLVLFVQEDLQDLHILPDG